MSLSHIIKLYITGAINGGWSLSDDLCKKIIQLRCSDAKVRFFSNF